MSTTSVLALVIEGLNQAGIDHMLAGSFASSLHGIARTTADIDLVIDPDLASMDALIVGLDERFYLDPASARQAVERRDQVNAIDNTTGWKVDLIVRKARPFSRTEFDRRQPARVLDVDLFVATAEDTIIAKLEWASIGGSERQLRDVTEVARAQWAVLEHPYIEHWTSELGIADLWQAVASDAAPS